MRVKVFPPHGCERSALDERGWAELPEGATVKDVLKLIRCSSVKADKGLAGHDDGRESCRLH